MKGFFIVLFCLFVYCAAQGSDPVFYQVQNGTCTEVPTGQCFNCSEYGFDYSYIIYTSGSYNYYNFYSGANCENFLYENEVYGGKCQEGFGECLIFGYFSKYTLYTLSISSDTPISLQFLSENHIAATVGETKATAQSGYLQGLRVLSNGETFRFEKRVSENTYTTNIGAYNFGETYEVYPFTFEVTAKNVDQLPSIPPAGNVLGVYPASEIGVAGSNSYPTWYIGELFVLYVFTDDQFDLTGITFENFCFSMHNLTYYPPYGDGNYNGNIGYIFQASAFEKYVTAECYVDSTGGGDYQAVACPLFYSSLGSAGICLNSSGLPLVEQPFHDSDQMSFSLF